MNSKADLQKDNHNDEQEPSRAKKVAEEISAELKQKMAEDDTFFADPEADGDELTQRIESYEEEIAKLKDQVLRSAAEVENIRKRAERDVADARKFAVTSFARDLLSVGENLQMALDNISDEARKEDENLNNLAKGVEMTAQELLRVFENYGITRINPKGERFDHNFHQAVAQIEDENHEPGTVVQVLQAGYVIKDRLLRPAMVTVSKGAGNSGNGDQTVNTKA